ncbi:hypothetical protein [Lysobacter xanthus]
MDSTSTSLRRFVSGRDGRIVIAQWPNLPLSAWFACWVLARLLPASHARDGIAFLGTAFLFTWAWLEIVDGDSPFRRALGGVVAAAIVVPRVLG